MHHKGSQCLLEVCKPDCLGQTPCAASNTICLKQHSDMAAAAAAV